MIEIIFRIAMMAIMLILGVYLGFNGLASSSGVTEHALVGAALCGIFILFLGPFWPDDHNLKIINNFFNRFPSSSAFAGYALLTLAGFFLAWATLTHPMQWSRTLGLIYKLGGPIGVASLWAIFGFVGLVGCVNALKNKS